MCVGVYADLSPTGYKLTESFSSLAVQELMVFLLPSSMALRFPPKLGSFISQTLPVAGDANTSNWRSDEEMNQFSAS